jgi:hypothetical protein
VNWDQISLLRADRPARYTVERHRSNDCLVGSSLFPKPETSKLEFRKLFFDLPAQAALQRSASVRSSTLRIHSHQTNSVQSKPAGPGSAPEIVGASISLTTLNDPFSWWAFTARAEGARPKCAAIALRGCMPASCLGSVTSPALMDLTIFQPPEPRTPAPQPNARTTLPKNTHRVYRFNRSTPRNGLFSLSELVAKFTQRSAHRKSRSEKCGRPALPPRRLVELGLKAKK